MQSITLALALATSASALVARDSPCCFGVTTDDGQHVGSLSDGQQRIGQSGLPDSKLCLSNGGLTDGSGRGCILTSPTTQFQCDTGAQPTTGFSVDSNGKVTYNGGTTFYACPTGDNGGYNIYSQAPAGQQGCKQVSLNADNCKAPAPAPAPAPSSSAAPAPAPVPSSSATAAPAPSSSAAPAPAPAPSSSAAPAPAPAPSSSVAPAPAPAPSSSAAPAPAPKPSTSSCPVNINGNYQYPHLIVPVDSSAPNSAKGTSYNGQVSSTVSSIFNFDVPQDYSGKQCSLIFLLPDQSQLTTSSYKLSGNGGIDFSELSGIANSGTTSANAPAVKTDYGVTTVSSGGAYSIATFECPAGQTVAYEAKASGDTSLDYFQDYNDGGIGLYLVSC